MFFYGNTSHHLCLFTVNGNAQLTSRSMTTCGQKSAEIADSLMYIVPTEAD